MAMTQIMCRIVIHLAGEAVPPLRESNSAVRRTEIADAVRSTCWNYSQAAKKRQSRIEEAERGALGKQVEL